MSIGCNRDINYITHNNKNNYTLQQYVTTIIQLHVTKINHFVPNDINLCL